MDLKKILDKAGKSALYLKLLNIGLRRMIPFNSPHKFCVEKVNTNSLVISAPYIRKNKNHINGIHACALATLCEYISGLSLARMLPPEAYRLILKSIHMDYHYQGKMKVSTEFGIDEQEVSTIKDTLQLEESVFRNYEVTVFDTAQNHICTGTITWQIKPWHKVKAKI